MEAFNCLYGVSLYGVRCDANMIGDAPDASSIFECRASVTPAGAPKRVGAVHPWLTPWAIFRRRCRG
jgi:hypothetical protein